jgi:selenide,water dikinase
VLSDALDDLEPSDDENLLVGFETSDDAAVYRLSPELAVISTVDYITPPVDDPYWFGQIAAANSISDVYAMGGKPVTALNLVMFPSKKLDISELKEILRGGNDKVLEAGASMAGGHSVDDLEPKYGLAVTGVVHPDRILANVGVKDGDALVLTKPIGSGVLFNARVAGKLGFKDLEKSLPVIAALNGTAMELALEGEVHAATDVTGFGIVGHALEMARGSRVEIRLDYSALPLYPHALEMYAKGQTTGSNEANRRLSAGSLDVRGDLGREATELLFDPQTSGGLLLAVPAARAAELVERMRKAGVDHAAVVGEAVSADQGRITVG